MIWINYHELEYKRQILDSSAKILLVANPILSRFAFTYQIRLVFKVGNSRNVSVAFPHSVVLIILCEFMYIYCVI